MALPPPVPEVVKELVEEGLKELSNKLHSIVPLRHFSEFHDATVLNKVAQEQGKKVLGQFFRSRNLSMDEMCILATKLGEGMQNQITQWMVINEDYRNQSDCFMRKRVADLCEEFKTSVDKKLSISEPDMPLNELNTFLENRKLAVVGFFQDMSKAGDSDFQDEYKLMLEKKLECLQKETVEYQSIHLEYKTTEEARLALEEVKKLVLEMSHQLKSKVEAYKGSSVPTRVLKEQMDDITKYVDDSKKGKLSKEYHQLFINGLLGMTQGAIRRLNKFERYITPEKAKEWAEGMDRKLISYCASEDIAEAEVAEEMQQTSVGIDESVDIELVTMTEYKNDGERLESGWDVSELQDANESSPDIMENLIENDGGQDEGKEETIRNNEGELPTISISSVASMTPTPTLGPDDIMDEDVENIRIENYAGDDEEETIGNNGEEQPTITITTVASVTPSSSRMTNSSSKDGNGNDLNRRRSGRSLCPEYITIIQGDCPMYKCDICLEKIQKHFLRYHGKFCDEADRSFQSNQSGGKWFSSSKAANVNVNRPRSHSEMKPKPHKCLTCNKEFAKKGNLRVHVRSHWGKAQARKSRRVDQPGKLPFNCSYCDYRCSCLSNFKKHVILHSGEHPYQCPTCEYTAAVKFSLRRHIRISHGQTDEVALQLANAAGVDYLQKNAQYGDGSHINHSCPNIESIVLSHAIKKANLKLRKGSSHYAS